MKKGFTLAELLITLCIIGIIAAILVPTIHNLMPNREKTRYMKAYNALTNIVSEFVQDDALFENGDLSKSDAPIVEDNSVYSNCSGDDKFGCMFCASLSTTQNNGSSCTTNDGMIWSFEGLTATLKFEENESNEYTFTISRNGEITLDDAGRAFVRNATDLKN